MDESRVRAYRVLHLKWDLARFFGGLSLSRPWQLLRESRAVRTATFRAFAFHNLAILSAFEFEGFVEDLFWQDMDWFRGKCPKDCHQYRIIFDRCLQGESVNIIAPDAVGMA